MNEYGLLFYFSEDFTDSDAELLQDCVVDLASSFPWTDMPPQFVGDTQKADAGDGDEPMRTVGGFLRLRPPDAVSDSEVEKAQFEEVKQIVKVLSDFSASTGCEFELELDGIYVGDIANGNPDELVTVGLLEAWRNNLGD